MFVAGYAVIVVLTCYLVALNVRAVVTQYQKDKNDIRLCSFLATLVISGSLIIGLSGAIVQRVIDSHNYLQAEAAESPIPRYQR